PLLFFLSFPTRRSSDLYVLMFVVPIMGYAMSSSFTQSDGVYFFGVNLPELLPKNDARFELFDRIHAILAYTLLGLVALHVAGAIDRKSTRLNSSHLGIS